MRTLAGLEIDFVGAGCGERQDLLEGGSVVHAIAELQGVLRNPHHREDGGNDRGMIIRSVSVSPKDGVLVDVRGH